MCAEPLNRNSDGIVYGNTDFSVRPTSAERQLPVDVVTQRFGRNGVMVTEYAVIGPNFVEWCRTSDEEAAKFIACAMNQMARVPT